MSRAKLHTGLLALGVQCMQCHDVGILTVVLLHTSRTKLHMQVNILLSCSSHMLVILLCVGRYGAQQSECSFLHLLVCLQIWGSVQHKGVQVLATLDEKLKQTLNTKLA